MPLPPASVSTKQYVILIVDDEDLILRLCNRILSEAGFRVETCATGLDGLQILDQQAIDLLLLDLNLPDINGFEVLEKARRLQPEMAISIMTGMDALNYAIAALQHGADGFLHKPFSTPDLIRAVEEALRGRRQRRQHELESSRLRAYQTLYPLTRALFAAGETSTVQTLLLQQVCEEMSGQAALLVLDQQPVAEAGTPAGIARLHQVVEQLHQGASRPNLQHAQNDAILYSHVRKELGVMVGTQPQASLPDAHQLHAWGLYVIGNGEREFTPAEAELFQLLAEQGAAALENAILQTELRRSLAELAASQQALIVSEKLALAGRMMASLAHEVNNPLQGLNNCLHLAAAERLTDEERQQWLHLAQSELERLSETVARMLAYYRPEQADHQATDLNQVLAQVIGLLSGQLEQARVRLSLESAPGPLLVMAVRQQLHQVFLNLILNALEAMPDGGILRIAARWIEPQARPGPGEKEPAALEVLFEDSGPGVPELQQRHLFEPFNSSKTNGLGLGLSICYGIISAHGGQIELGRSTHNGACFIVRLPAYRPEKDGSR